MSGQLQYRSGNAAEIESLKKLALLAYSQYSKVLDPEHWQTFYNVLTNHENWIKLVNHSEIFICEENGKIIGMAFLISSNNPNEIYDKDWSYIRLLGVDPEHTGRGIAANLTNRCIEKARKNGEKIITLHTSEFMDAARHIYEKAGFEIHKEIPPRFGKRYWLYMKAL